MTAEEKSSPAQKRTILLCPKLVILGALLLYGLTLHHWVTLSSLPIVSRITGWDWSPLPLPWRQTQVAPLFLVLTCPVRLLPVAWQPLALNAFTALCAALTLGLLAASVHLLPHDRTREQRQREGGEFSLLSLPTAFLPALLAVLVLSFQLTFWRNAIAATGNMLDVLVFAFLIFCLLKFRISQNDNWLAGFAFVYGLGTTNNWALIGFFPCFAIALIWIKGVSLFNWRLLARLAGCGLLGLLLYLLIPAMGSLSAQHTNFLSLLHMELGTQSFSLRLVPRWIVAVTALPTLLPLLFAGIRWPSFEGELSAAGNALTKWMFRLLHVVFLLLALMMFFDFKYSPSLSLQEAPGGLGFLTFFYMGALAIGYFSGYILLVFGRGAAQTWERRGPLTKAFNTLILALLWLLAVAAPCCLFYENVPHIRAGRKNFLSDFSSNMIQNLPDRRVVLIADDPTEFYLAQTAFARAGKTNQNILIDTASLPHREYIHYLLSRYPELKKFTTAPEKLPSVIPPDALVGYLYSLGREYPLYYLHTSFGYYFEAFYLKQHGLVYELRNYTKDAVLPPSLTPQDLKANQDAWAKIQQKSLGDLPAMAKLDEDAAMCSIKYSVALDFWGVELQRAGYLKEAGARFAQAHQINPENFIAKINGEYNARLQRNDHQPLNSRDLIKAINRYRGIVPILRFNGPPDEPDLDQTFGRLMAEGHDWRQAAGMFERRLQLLPDDPTGELDLAKTFVDSGRPEKALDLIRKVHSSSAVNKWEVTRVEALAYFGKNDFATAEKLLQNAVREDPHDGSRVSTLAEFYRVTAYAAIKEMNAAKDPAAKAQHGAESTRRFKNSLYYLTQELAMLPAPNPSSSLPSGVPEALLKKAEVEMMLKSFPEGIATLGKVIDLQPNNPTALLNRAIAQAQIHQFKGAKNDYKTLRKLLGPQSYIADYGLAEIDVLETNRADEITDLKHYLQNAPKERPEYQQVQQRLKKLEGP